MVAEGDAPMMEGAQDGRKTVSVTGAGETEFGIIRYTEPGVYNYTIIEENTNLPGYTYDSSVWSMKVIVEDNGKGELTAERIFQKGGTTAEKPVFVNQYTKIIVPDTSDHTNMIGWAAALLISLLIASFTGFALKKW
jgi:pilin isopeptide linkage protein